MQGLSYVIMQCDCYIFRTDEGKGSHAQIYLLMRTGPRCTHGSCPNGPIILGCWFCNGVQEDNFANSQKSIDKLTKDLELMKDYTTITEVLSNIWPLSCSRLNDSDKLKTSACFRSYGAALQHHPYCQSGLKCLLHKMTSLANFTMTKLRSWEIMRASSWQHQHEM